MDPIEPTIHVLDEEDASQGIVESLGGLPGRVAMVAYATTLTSSPPTVGGGCLVIRSSRAATLLGRAIAAGLRLPAVLVDTSNLEFPPPPGAVAIFRGSADPEDLVEAIELAITVDARWTELSTEFERLESITNQLKRRDRETLEMLLAGRMNKHMAKKWGITERAVEMRRASVMKRFGVSSTPELVEAVATHRILSDLRTVSLHPGFVAFRRDARRESRG